MRNLMQNEKCRVQNEKDSRKPMANSHWQRRNISIGVLLVLFAGMGLSGQQWQSVVNLTNDGFTNDDRNFSYNNAWNIACDTAGNVSVVWYQGAEIYYKEKIDTVWMPDTVVMVGSRYPSIWGDKFGNIHLVVGDDIIFYKEKTDSGWSEDIQLTDSSNFAEYPSLTVDNLGNVHCVWEDYRDGNWEIYYRMRDSTGWLPDERLTVDSASSDYPSVAADTSGDVYVVWEDSRAPGWGIFYNEKVGGVWSGDTCLSDTSGLPCITVDIYGNIHTVWHDGGIHYKEKTSSGWLPDTVISGGSYPQIAADGIGNIHIIWMDTRDGYERVYYKMRNSLGNWSDDESVSQVLPLESWEWDGIAGASITADRWGNVHIVWAIDRFDTINLTGGTDIFYREKIMDTTGIRENAEVRMRNAELLQNYPNPFTRSTEIKYRLTAHSPQLTAIKVYDISGRLIKTLVNEEQSAGYYSIKWNGRDNNGNDVSSGVYFYRLSTPEGTMCKKMILMR